jgi:hypothetical protein
MAPRTKEEVTAGQMESLFRTLSTEARKNALVNLSGVHRTVTEQEIRNGVEEAAFGGIAIGSQSQATPQTTPRKVGRPVGSGRGPGRPRLAQNEGDGEHQKRSRGNGLSPTTTQFDQILLSIARGNSDRTGIVADHEARKVPYSGKNLRNQVSSLAQIMKGEHHTIRSAGHGQFALTAKGKKRALWAFDKLKVRVPKEFADAMGVTTAQKADKPEKSSKATAKSAKAQKVATASAQV